MWFQDVTLDSLGVAGLVAGISFFVLVVIKTIVLSRLHLFASKTNSKIDDALSESANMIGWPVYLILPIYIGSRFLMLPAGLKQAIVGLTLIVVGFYLANSLQLMVAFGLKRLFKFQRSQGEEIDTTISGVIVFSAKVVIWIVIGLFVLQNLGFNVTALLGGVGIAGLAISFALQNILSDVFSFFSIYFDKPFTVGDFIDIGSESGTVESIGLKSTRVRTLQGQELVVSNSQLTSAQIHNYRKLEKRRVVMNIGVSYETSHKKLEKIPPLVTSICDTIDQIELGRIHLSEMGEYGLTYELVYFVQTNDYAVYMDAQQKLILNILKNLEKEKITLAYPAQTVVLQKA